MPFEIPNDAQKRVYLVSQAMKAFNGDPLLLVWFHDWSVWPSGQRMHVFDRFRQSYGETRLLIDSPGHLFEGNEIEDAISFVRNALLGATSVDGESLRPSAFAALRLTMKR